MKTTQTYDHYYKYDELTSLLKKYAEENPDYCLLEENATTPEGRKQWCMSITKLSTGSFEDKPAYGVNANIHAGEVTGTMAAMYFIDYLLTNKEDPEVDWLLSHFTVYVIPRITPDGAEYYLTTPYSVRSYPKFYPYEEDLPGLHPMDLDGDGVIRRMRVQNPNGTFKISKDNPEIMVRRQPDDIEGPFYDIYKEGIIKEKGGETAEKAEGEINPAPEHYANDFNRNFPLNWYPENVQRGAGHYALCHSETAALASHMFKKKNMVAALNFHTAGGQYLFPPGHKHVKDCHPEDISVFRAFGKIATEETGYPAMNILDDYVGDASMIVAGDFDTFASYTLGIFDFTCECWNPVTRAGHPETWPRPKNIPDEDIIAAYADVLKWLDENEGGKGYKSWTAFDHPQLGKVEIGGLDEKYVMQNPPADFLQQECEKHTRYLLRTMKTLPRLALEVTSEHVDGDVYKIDAVVRNLGYLGTSGMKEAETLGIARPVTVTLDGDLKMVTGEKEESAGILEGSSGKKAMLSTYGPATLAHKPCEKHLTWVVLGKKGTKVKLEASSPRAGKVTVETEL